MKMIKKLKMLQAPVCGAPQAAVRNTKSKNSVTDLQPFTFSWLCFGNSCV